MENNMSLFCRFPISKTLKPGIGSAFKMRWDWKINISSKSAKKYCMGAEYLFRDNVIRKYEIETGGGMGKEGKTDFTNETQQNLMRIVEYLATDVFRPTTVKEIMDALEISQNKATWALHNLRIGGWAEQIADAWRLSPRIVRIADSVRANLGENVKRYTGEKNGK